jgi:uncharacterized integral membrane protein
MRYLSWALKILIFIILLSFALQNTSIVTLHTFLGYYWQAPLIFVMLTCFVVGAIFGVLASLTYVIKLRRELMSIRKALKTHIPTAPAPVEYILEPPRDAL